MQTHHGSVDTTKEDAILRELAREDETMQLSLDKFHASFTRQRENGGAADSSVGRTLINRLCAALAVAIEDFIDPKDKTRGWNAGQLATVRTTLKGFILTPTELAYCGVRGVLTECLNNESIHMLTAAATLVWNNISTSNDYRQFATANPDAAKIFLENIQRKRHGSIANVFKRNAIKKAAELHDVDLFEPTSSEGLRVGIKLIELLIESTGAVEMELAVCGRQDKKWLVLLSEETQKLVSECADFYAELSPLYRPMLCEPMDWESLFDGGYLLPIRSLHPALIKARRREIIELANYDFSKVITAVNTIQKTPWRVNERVLDIAKTIWEAGGGKANIPLADLRPLPVRPGGFIPDDQWVEWKEENKELYRTWAEAVTATRHYNNKAVGERIRVSTQLSMAGELRHEERFYYVWTADFRGRLYPLSSFLTPQADDLGKALLEFSVAKPLTAQGAYWLLIHVANCAGVDKKPFPERIQWVKDHHAEIIACAQDPLANQTWMTMDSPWQFLAAAMDYEGYCREGNSHYSHIPVAMDGSCNGLQHLSAILRDDMGGKSVNLLPADTPSDIYTDVLKEVIAIVEERKATSVDESERFIAELWLPHLSRNVVKRPVMTTPYGVRRMGIKDQIMEQVRDGEFFVGYQISFRKCAAWLTPIVEEAIGRIVKGAPVVMGWLKEIASLANRADKSKTIGVAWTVPGSGFRCIQRYYELDGERVKLIIGGQRIRPLSGKLSKHIYGARQSLGIAPNFIHSLDASMLVMTVNKLSSIGITNFALIHDSYATHACDVDVMNQVLREEFVALYRANDPLVSFMDDVRELYQNIELPVPPEKGGLDIGMVQYSKYFFA